MAAMTLGRGKLLLHLAGRRRRVVDADDIYYLEAQGDETDVRLRAARRLRDVRSLGEVLKEIGPLGFVRTLAFQLPPDFPRDPADRLIGATARAHGMTLVTKDQPIRDCPLIDTAWERPIQPPPSLSTGRVGWRTRSRDARRGSTSWRLQ